ncbi:type VI secretion system tip protein VgrG [Wielerella bovis]|nr:type VI secretion system tip protein VgrG [Wielerella bovis]ULJ61513.1 type VI secretion system tip protein VgrG [Wielerella bovis]
MSESLNQFSQLSIQATSVQELDLLGLIGQQGLFRIQAVSADVVGLGSTLPLRAFHGQIISCERLSHSADEITYRLVLSNRFSALNQYRTSRLFQNQSVPDIIASLLRKHGYAGNDFRFLLSRSYPIREYVTQYDESDAHFIQRLCEEEGIWFYFAQTDERDVWTFADDVAHYQRHLSAYAFRENAGLESVGAEAVSVLQLKQQSALRQVRVDDYNYRTMDVDLSAQWQNPAVSGVSGSLNIWGLHHKTPSEAQTYTRLLREYSQLRQLMAQGRSNVVGLSPSVVLHTQPSVHEAGWLMISVVHRGSRDEAYQNEFKAISAGLPFRPERLTAQPKVSGSLNARVVSPDNYTYAYIDDMGRYRVRLPFDLDEWSPGGDSRPVRLAKPYAGPSYGQHFPLHEGTEVMLSFVQGNPDRPYISGVMHDSKNQEHVNNEWNTRNMIRTWANNKLRMEDKQGQEHIKLATDYQKSQLNLGHIVNQTREKRGDNGEGFELRTDGWGSIRSNKGLLLTGYGQQGAQGNVLNMDETIAQLEQALALAKNLNKAAKTAQNAETSVKSQQNQLSGSLKDLRQSAIIQTAPNGIASNTPQSQLHTAGNHIQWISGGDSNISAGQNITAHAQEGFYLFAQNKGAKIQANQGPILIQAQNDRMQVNALKDLELSSSSSKVMVAGKQEVMITGGGGSYIQLKEGEIILASPKIVRIKAPAMPVGGSDSFHFNGFPFTDKICIPCKIAELTGKPVNPISGIKVLPDETDFAFDGLLPFVWSRSYYSDIAESGWLGRGWQTSISSQLRRHDGQFSYTDTQGRTFPLPNIGEQDGKVLYEAEQIIFERIDNGSYQISSLDGSSKLRFSPLHLGAANRQGEGEGVYLLTRVSDRLGNDYRIIYNEHGLPEYVIDNLQRIIRFDIVDISPSEQFHRYRIQSITLQPEHSSDVATGEVLVRYEYDENGDLSAVYDANGVLQRQFSYQNGVMIRHQNAAGLIASYEYDQYTPQGKVLRSHTNTGEEWRFTYHQGHTAITDALERTEHVYFDHHGEVIKKVFADGSSVLTERDALGRPVKIMDEMGRETRYRYNEYGLLSYIGGEQGSSQRIHYDQHLNPIEIVLPHGQKTQFEYDANGLLSRKSDGKGHSTTYRYNEYGQIIQITDAKNNGYFFEYDHNHRLINSIDCSGKTTQYRYDDRGRVIAVINANDGQTTYDYHTNGLLNSITYPDGQTEYHQYDEANRLTAHIDAQGHRTEYRYDIDGRPIERMNALGHTFRYKYDRIGRLNELINENGNTYRFAYDERNRLLSETGFDGKLSRYTYNPAGELVQESRYHHQNHPQLLQTTVYHRDRLGRIIQKDSHWADNTHSESSRYFYDKLSRVTRAHNAHSEIRLSYNSEGLLAKEQFYLLKEPIRYDVIQRDNYLHSQTTEYQYDVLGNRSQTLLPTGDVLNYLYYGSGHLHHINFNGETITDIERDNLHRPIVRSAGGLNTRFQFDPMGRLKQQISQLAEHDFAHHSIQNSLIGRQYHYDATGNLIRTDDKLNGNTDYAYDPLGRILQAADERFAFDPAHNISDEGQTIKGNRLAEYNGIRYRYDGLGNLSERHSDSESQFYRYDADNQLIEARIEKANLPTQYWQYRYDPFGRRMLKINAKTKQETLFTWEGSHLLQELRQDKVYTYVYTEQNSYEPLAQIQSFRQPEKHKTDVKPTIYYYHTDQIGIPREMTDEEGNIVWRGQYSGWGKLLHEEKANNHIHQPFRLQNQYADEETGLHYNFFRYYDAHCGRFTQQDPIGLLGGENLYKYTTQPMRYIDPLGLCNCEALKRFVNYVNTKGKYIAVAYEYSPISNSNLIPLNDPCDSIYGKVDIDWMLRLSYSSISGGDFGAWLDYRVAKFYWNVGRSVSDEYELEFHSITHPTNELAPYVSNRWLNDNVPIETIFKPALDKCACKTLGKCK